MTYITIQSSGGLWYVRKYGERYSEYGDGTVHRHNDAVLLEVANALGVDIIDLAEVIRDNLYREGRSIIPKC